MKKKQRTAQVALVSIGLLLFVLTYLYYPNLNKDKLFGEQSSKEDLEKTANRDQTTSFEDIKYKGLYDLDKPFTIEAKDAYILNEEPHLVYMKKMHVILYLGDGRIVNITSDEGRYNKLTYDCYFQKNVIASDGETQITGKNLDLLATGNTAKIYNDVRLDYPTSSLQADKIDYDFETKHFKVSMFDDKAIKMKVIQ